MRWHRRLRPGREHPKPAKHIKLPIALVDPTRLSCIPGPARFQNAAIQAAAERGPVVANGAQRARNRRAGRGATTPAALRKKVTQGGTTRKPKFSAPPVEMSSVVSRPAKDGCTPLPIPYANKEVAQKIGARYRADG